MRTHATRNMLFIRFPQTPGGLVTNLCTRTLFPLITSVRSFMLIVRTNAQGTRISPHVFYHIVCLYLSFTTHEETFTLRGSPVSRTSVPILSLPFSDVLFVGEFIIYMFVWIFIFVRFILPFIFIYVASVVFTRLLTTIAIEKSDPWNIYNVSKNLLKIIIFVTIYCSLNYL